MESNNFKVNNRLIAKNTFVLYLRMFVLLLISLYSSRLILQALGVEDYGTYNVVGGIVALFALIKASLSDTTIRFLTYEIGSAGDRFQTVFSMSLLIHIVLSLLIVIIAETIGLWFLYHVLVIPEGRMNAAFWCFQLSIVTFVIRMISLPYDAVIISYERMSAFAYISIIDSIGLLIIAWCICDAPIDRLILYSSLVALLAFAIRIINVVYCKRHFIECRFTPQVDRHLFRGMFSFAGWSMLGGASWQLMTTGVDFLVNIYFGVVVNAARAIASQVNSGVSLLVSNFSRAIDPQIFKVHASGDKDELFSLIFRGARVSYFLILFLAIPVLFETKTILEIWLVIVPDHAVAFVRLLVISSMIGIVSKTLVTAAQATGNIKKYHIVISGIGLLAFPIAWLFLWLGQTAEMTYVAIIIVYVIQFFFRLLLLHELIDLPIAGYMKSVIMRIVITTVFALIPVSIICCCYDRSLSRLFCAVIISIISSILSVFFFGITNSERCVIVKYINNKWCGIKKR